MRSQVVAIFPIAASNCRNGRTGGLVNFKNLEAARFVVASYLHGRELPMTRTRAIMLLNSEDGW